MGDVGAPLDYYARSLGSFIGYWHMLAIFSILSGIFLLFLAYLILKANPKKAKNRFMALMLVTEALRCFTSMLFWVYAWPEEMLNILRPGRVVYYTMSLQLFFLYMAAATFYSKRAWAEKISGFFQFHGLYLLPLFCLTFILVVSSFMGGQIRPLATSVGSIVKVRGQEEVRQSLEPICRLMLPVPKTMRTCIR